jgi:hypothetical protein
MCKKLFILSFLAIIFVYSQLILAEKNKKYTDKKFNFSIEYPEKWKLKKENQFDTVLSIKAPNEINGFSPIITIRIVNIENATFEEFVLSNRKNIDIEKYKDELPKEIVEANKKAFKTSKLISENDIKISGKQAKEFIYEAVSAEDNITSQAIFSFFIKKEKNKNFVYSILGMTRKDDFVEYEQIFKEVTKSFKLIK